MDFVIGLCLTKDVSFDWLVHGSNIPFESDSLDPHRTASSSRPGQREGQTLRSVEINVEIDAVIDRLMALKSEDTE